MLNKTLIEAVKDKTCKPDEQESKDPHIEVESQIISRIGYTYQIWKTKTANGKFKRICVRCAVHSLNKTSNEYMNLYALHEWNTQRQKWGKEIDNQAAGCLTREISDNQNKFARWTVQSLLGGVKKMRFAFIQRKNDKSNTEHKVVGTLTMTTEEFAKQINLNMKNCWAILEEVVSVVIGTQETSGDYMFVREVAAPNYRLYKANTAIEEESEYDDEEEEEEGEEEEEKQEVKQE